MKRLELKHYPEDGRYGEYMFTQLEDDRKGNKVVEFWNIRSDWNVLLPYEIDFEEGLVKNPEQYSKFRNGQKRKSFTEEEFNQYFL